MIFEFSTWVLNTHRYELSHCGNPIKIRRKVFKVLSYLLRCRDRNVSRKELLEQVWSQQCVTEESVTSCIKEARQILGDTHRKKRFIETVHGFGYRFSHPVAVTENTAPPAVAVVETKPPTLNVKISRHAADLKAGDRPAGTSCARPQQLSGNTQAMAIGAGEKNRAVVENVVCRIAPDQTTWWLSGSCDNTGAAPPALAPILDAIRHLNGDDDPIRLYLQWE